MNFKKPIFYLLIIFVILSMISYLIYRTPECWITFWGFGIIAMIYGQTLEIDYMLGKKNEKSSKKRR